MGLRCSLLGHDYGESEIEREREEQGNEVVVTVREFQECKSCGDQQVVSENKEVTAIEEPEPTPEPIASREQPESGRTTESSATGDRAVAESEPSDAAVSAESEPTPEPVSFNDDDFEPPQTAEEDDGVILDDDDDEEDDVNSGRGHGEWPDPEDTNVGNAGSGATEWPDTGMDDEGFSAEVGDGGRTNVNFGGGLTPESAPEADEGAEVVEAESRDDAGFVRTTRPEPQTETGFTRAREAPKPDQALSSNPDADLICPECGEIGGAATGSSLRAGDICPECRRGYLSEQE